MGRVSTSVLTLALAGCFIDTSGLGPLPDRPIRDGGQDAGGGEGLDGSHDGTSADALFEADRDRSHDAELEADGCLPSPETCNGSDDDCDGSIDEDPTDGIVFHPDADSDGFGDGWFSVEACAAPEGYVQSAGDCDDLSSEIHPEAQEGCNARDDDCDGEIDEEACDDCHRGLHESNTYLFCTERLTWLRARSFCAERGYDLVVVDDLLEHEWLWTEAAGVELYDWWIGLTDVENEGTYVWVDGTTAWKDGSSVRFTNWRRELVEDVEDQDCVELDNGTAGLWDDVSCDQTQPFICETAR